MKQTTHVTYIKLPSYLATYFRRVMQLRHDQPLVLPKYENREYFLPFLYENPDFYRNPSKNSRGYYKDTVSYTEEAYNIAVNQVQNIEFSPCQKIPTIKECADLQPFLLPNTIVLTKTKTSPERQVAAHGFFELQPAGAERIRAYIHDMFFAELHNFVLTKQRTAERLNADSNTTFFIETWLTLNGIISNDPVERKSQLYTQRTLLYRYDQQHFQDGDKDSIRRLYYRAMKEKKITPNYSRKLQPSK